MLPYKFTPSLFLRSAVYSSQSFSTDHLQEVLNSEFFRIALYFASESLFRQAALKGFLVQEMSEGMKHSLLKYYNRMSYRATPFGMFASFTSVSWGDGTGLIFNGEEQLNVRADFRLSVALTAQKIPARGKESIYTNPTIYKLGKELRYIKTGWDAVDGSGGQGIAATESNGLLDQVLRYCKGGQKPADLLSFLTQICPYENPADLAEELLSEELILSSSAPNVTGENYLKRISEIYDDDHISLVNNTVQGIGTATDVNIKHLDDLAGLGSRDEKIRSPFYVNYEKKADGSADKKYQTELLEALHCLSRLQPEKNEGSLDRFRKSFYDRFEEQEVLLMHALDPDYGIGYEQLEEAADSGDLLKGISFSRKETGRQISWGPVQELLLQKMMNVRKGRYIQITDDDLNSLPTSKKMWPPGIAVMFRPLKDKLFIEEAGGATAVSLMGRFTPFSQQILKEAQEIADQEQDMNPDVLFAEIAYFSEEHAANINTRENVRKYEIPVLVYSTLSPEGIIDLNDLYISVKNNELILRSARLNKRIVPRLSTAYNHTRSELPAFRFLSDLQYQGLSSRLGINPENLIPGLNDYPGIEYKNCVLSEAIWVLKAADLKDVFTAPDSYIEFLKLAEMRKISRYFALSESDRQLVFDLNDPNSISLFLNESRAVKSITIKEFFVPSEDDTHLRDKDGKPYVHQLLAAMICTEETYQPIPESKPEKGAVRRNFAPADEWIYYKIYCSAQSANEILVRKIYPLLRKYQNPREIEKWFFIRYFDPEHHLRIRIRGSEGILKEIPMLFMKALKPLVKAGLISNVQIDTYKREMERYGPETIDLSEEVFCSSSELVIAHLKKEIEEIGTVRFAVFSVDLILGSFDFGIFERIDLLERISVSLMNESGDKKTIRNDLNKKFRVYQQGIRNCLEGDEVIFSSKEKSLIKKFQRDLKALKLRHHQRDPARLQKIAGDILHMHMNRIFSTDQRKRELVIYYLSLRYYLSLKARMRS